MSAVILGDWPDHDWQVWEYAVSHAQLHLRGIPTGSPGGDCVDLLFKPVHRLATSTMSWSGLSVALRRVTPEGAGVFFLVSRNLHGRHQGHGVVRAGSLHLAQGRRDFTSNVLDDAGIKWKTLWTTAN